jgi:hypothetical protein
VSLPHLPPRFLHDQTNLMWVNKRASRRSRAAAEHAQRTKFFFPRGPRLCTQSRIHNGFLNSLRKCSSSCRRVPNFKRCPHLPVQLQIFHHSGAPALVAPSSPALETVGQFGEIQMQRPPSWPRTSSGFCSEPYRNAPG